MLGTTSTTTASSVLLALVFLDYVFDGGLFGIAHKFSKYYVNAIVVSITWLLTISGRVRNCFDGQGFIVGVHHTVEYQPQKCEKKKKIVDLIFKLEHLFFTLYFSYLLEKKKCLNIIYQLGKKKYLKILYKSYVFSNLAIKVLLYSQY